MLKFANAWEFPFEQVCCWCHQAYDMERYPQSLWLHGLFHGNMPVAETGNNCNEQAVSCNVLHRVTDVILLSEGVDEEFRCSTAILPLFLCVLMGWHIGITVTVKWVWLLHYIWIVLDHELFPFYNFNHTFCGILMFRNNAVKNIYICDL
jgi:hypothetical protein